VEFNLADLFECVVDHVPDRVAVVHGARRSTYAELDERASRFAHALRGLGAAAGSHVGLYLHTGTEHLEAMLACFKLRAVAVNVNPRYVRDELAYLCEDADLVGLVHDRDLADAVAGLPQARRERVWTVTVDGDYESVLAAGSPARDLPPRSADDHYILYTGGTTGDPKGVVWRHEDIFFATMGGRNPGGRPIARPEEIGPNARANRSQRVAPFLRAHDPAPDAFVSLALGPLTHASGQWSALGTLLGGGTVVLYPGRHLDMAVVVDLIERERVVALNLVGDTSARPLLAELRRRGGAARTGSLLLIGSGGSILSADVKQELLARIPTVLAIVDGIGSSEVPAQAVAVTTRGERPVPLRFAAKDTTCVFDDELREIEPGSGRVGRLATRGRLPLGYYNDPDKTAATFVAVDGERWTLPGDMATVDADGAIRLLGRGSLCINTGGEKVYPEEVEAVVKAHPGVADALVVGEADPRWGQRVTAIVEPVDPDAPPTLDALRAHARPRLAGYKLPRALHVVDRVRRSAAGKADYRWAAQLSEGIDDRSPG
jgi:acyl-CoA synthetase (AMP-forming)/AMP-acid ligase II